MCWGWRSLKPLTHGSSCSCAPSLTLFVKLCFHGNCGLVIKVANDQCPCDFLFLHHTGMSQCPGPLSLQLKHIPAHPGVSSSQLCLSSTCAVVSPLWVPAHGPCLIPNSCPWKLSSSPHQFWLRLAPLPSPHSHIWLWRAILTV